MPRKKQIDFLSKDYEAFRNEFINAIPKHTDRWTDHSSSDMGIILLELAAYGLDVLSYYKERRINELYLPTALLRQSIIDITQLVGYTLATATPSRVDLIFETEEDLEVTIPRRFRVSTDKSETEDAIIFETTERHTIPEGETGLEQENGEYIHKIPAVQGVTIDEVIGSSDGSENQQFRLTRPLVIDDSLEVFVDEGTGFHLWKNVTDDIFAETEDGRHYWTEKDARDYTYVLFGDDETGKVPSEGTNNIRARYRVGGGERTNVGSETIVKLRSTRSGVKGVFNPEPAVGGEDRESRERARINAPRMVRTNERAVHKKDFEDLAIQNPGVIKAIGEETFDYENNFNLYIIPEDYGTPSESIKNEIYNDIIEDMVANQRLNVLDPLYVDYVIEVNIDVESNYLQDDVREDVEETLEERFDPVHDLMDFGKKIKLMNIIATVEAVPGVYNATVEQPENDIVIEELEYPRLDEVIVNAEGGVEVND